MNTKKWHPSIYKIVAFTLIFFTSLLVTDLLAKGLRLVAFKGEWALTDILTGLFADNGSISVNMYYLCLAVGYTTALYLVGQTIKNNIQLAVYSNTLKKTVREVRSIRRKIIQLAFQIVEQEKENSNEIATRDSNYADLLSHLQAEFDEDRVDVESIHECSDSLANKFLNGGIAIKELYALTNLSGKSWLTRTMLIYLIRTIQLSDKIADDSKKWRIFLIDSTTNSTTKDPSMGEETNETSPTFASVKSLHEGFCPTSEIASALLIGENNLINPYKIDSFLYIKDESDKEYCWRIKKSGGKKFWRKYHDGGDGLDAEDISPIRSLVEKLKKEKDVLEKQTQNIIRQKTNK